MKIRILYLYPDLMNLYGSSGNIRCLVRHLKAAGAQLEVLYRSVGEEISLEGVHFVYIGAGTERSQKRAMRDLLRLREELIAYLAAGGFCLLVGNAAEMLGRCVTDREGNVFPGLNLFDFETTEVEKRTVTDVVCTCPLISEKIIGFLNLQSRMTPAARALFTIESGGVPAPAEEGYFDHNLFATHLCGPLLVRNPQFRAMLERRLYERCGLELAPVDLPYEIEAYQESLKNLSR